MPKNVKICIKFDLNYIIPSFLNNLQIVVQLLFYSWENKKYLPLILQNFYNIYSKPSFNITHFIDRHRNVISNNFNFDILNSFMAKINNVSFMKNKILLLLVNLFKKSQNVLLKSLMKEMLEANKILTTSY